MVGSHPHPNFMKSDWAKPHVALGRRLDIVYTALVSGQQVPLASFLVG
jgi:hypothetical protein